MDAGKRQQAVIFDMDGLMLDTERIALQAWQAAAAAHGHALGEDIYLRTVGLNTADSEALPTRTLGASFPLREISALQRTLFDQQVAVQGIPPKRGLFELLIALEKWGVLRAVATSTACTLALEILTRMNLSARFHAIVGGDQVARGKPAPDILLAAAERLGVAARRCIVLEDSEPGILAAHAAGMASILIPDLRQASPGAASLALRVVPSPHEAKAVLAAVFGGSA